MSAQHVKRHASSGRAARVRRAAAVTCLLAFGLGVSAAQAQPSSTTDDAAVPGMHAAPFQGPPPVRLVGGSATLALHPYASCWTSAHGGVCYDGPPPRPLPSLGGTSTPVHLAFTRDAWHFSVTAADTDGQSTKITLIRTGPRDWRLDLSQLANGRYRIDIFGKGPQGDVLAAGALTLT